MLVAAAELVSSTDQPLPPRFVSHAIEFDVIMLAGFERSLPVNAVPGTPKTHAPTPLDPSLSESHCRNCGYCLVSAFASLFNPAHPIVGNFVPVLDVRAV